MLLLAREVGPLVNTAAAVVGASIGFAARGIPERIQKGALDAIGLAVIAIGLSMALFGHPDLVIVTAAMALGALAGGFLQIEERIEHAAQRLQGHGSQGSSRFVEGFLLASIVWCVGSMAIVGALQSGLGDPRLLFTKAVLDGVSGIFFASALGIGVLAAAVPLLLYEGLLALAAASMQPILGAAEIGPLSSAGGLLIVAIGLNMLGMTKIKVGNLLPALVLAALLGSLKAHMGLPV